MIESNIINWIDLSDSMQFLDVYGHKRWLKFFDIMRILVGYKTFSLFFFIILKVFFFFQILLLSLVNTPKESDSAIMILKYIEKVLLIQELITNKKTYMYFIAGITILTLIVTLLIIYLLISIKYGKFYSKLPVYTFNLINCIVIDYLIGPIIQICLMAFHCSGGKHVLLGDECFVNWLHWLISILSFINLLIWVVISVILSIYYNEIGSINDSKVCARINCNYEFIVNIVKIIMFVFAYITQNFAKESNTLRIIFELFVFLTSLAIAIYVYQEIFFYNKLLHLVIELGWVFVTWFSLIIVLKSVLVINDTTIFHLIGWFVLAWIIYYLEESRKEFLLTDFNIFDIKCLKDIELFKMTLIDLIGKRSVKSKTLLVGLTKKFEEFAEANPEVSERFNKLSRNDHLKKQFNSNSALPILSIIYILYEHHLDKSILKDEILLNMCYFLMNQFKNPTFAVNLCSKFKVENHKHLYFKFVLMEEIKEFFMRKLAKSSNKESIKHVEVGSVILYNIYIELFKLKIYDAACNQIDYFDILKNKVTNPKTTESFLKLGENILTLRKEILAIWEKIVDLNPFSDESERDYMLYLETILQDDILARQEAKKFVTLKANKLSERNNIYHSMFIRELSSVILIDGYSMNGKFLYTTPNFPSLFNFTGKEILNMCVDDLLPGVVAEFHKDLIENAIKYSNINYIFNEQKDFLLRGKTGGIFNIKLYAKSVPNLSFGLIYMVQISKVQDHSYMLILNKEFKINGLTDMIGQGEMYTMANNYGLTQGLCGHHIGIVLPEILLQLEYKDGEYFVQKGDIDLKGTLYPVSVWKDFENKVENILSKIKQNGKLQNNDDQKNDMMLQYDELIRDISTKYQKSFSVFYKIVTKSFLDGQYKYYRVYITNDLITLNENALIPPSVAGSQHFSKKTGVATLVSGDKRSKNSTKQIKLKMENKSEKRLLGDGAEKKEEEGKKADEEKKSVESPIKNKGIKPDGVFSRAPSSLNTKSSIDSASFNKLKNGILEKREISLVKIMKTLCCIFIVLTIILIIIDSNIIENNFEDLRDYLQQNLFFNHSKITVSCIYLSGLNLKWIKDGYIPETNCELNTSCTLFYSQLLSNCIDDIKLQKENSSTFYEDFKIILDVAKDIQLDVFNLTTKDTLSIDIDNLLNLLISNGLKLNANLDLYYLGENIYDINSLNLLDQSLGFLSDDNVVGFDDNAKEDKIKEHFSPVQFSLIIDLVFVIIVFMIFGFLIFKLNEMEKYYITKLISFHSNNFDLYLKTLEELKKKLRNENGEDEDKINGELELGELSSRKGSKNEGDDKKDKKGTKSKQDEDDDEKEKESNKKRKANKKQRGAKQAKANQQKLEKKRIMSKFFFTWNVLLIIKIFFSLLISFSYYIVVSFIESSKKEDYLEFDGTTDAIEGVFKNSFDIFISLKTELALYENFEVERKRIINKLSENSSIPLEFNGKNYTNPEDVRKLPSYYMSIPNNNEIIIPKLGNLLMPLVKDLEGASDATKELNELYNTDACFILFGNKEEPGYQSCSKFWSGIIVKGMEQSITQMGVVINTVIDELNSLNVEGMNIGGSSGEYNSSITKRNLDGEVGRNTFESILLPTSAFSQYEVFIEYYLLNAYMKTVSIFLTLKKVKIKSIYDTFRIILYSYIVGVALLFFVLLYLVYSSKNMFNTFLNFVGILPVKFLLEDDTLYKDVLRLEQHIF